MKSGKQKPELADLAQIESRLISTNADLRSNLCVGKDVHKYTAARIFGVSESEVTTAQRNYAKTVNYYLIYALGKESC